MYKGKVPMCAMKVYGRQEILLHSFLTLPWHIIIIKANEMHYFSTLFW